MAVNGIELAIGQTWRLRNGAQATIVARSETPLWPWILDNHQAIQDDGCCSAIASTVYDLESIVGCTTPMAVTLTDVSNQSFQRSIGRMNLESLKAHVGDVKSQAKGSGARYNSGKPPYELVPLRIMADLYANLVLSVPQAQALDALYALADFQERANGKPLLTALAALSGVWPSCAKVFNYGRGKYAEFNWAKGMAWSIPLACAARHLEAIILGQSHDPESKELHVGHVACNIVMLLTYERTFLEGDDRAAAGLLAPLSPVAELEVA